MDIDELLAKGEVRVALTENDDHEGCGEAMVSAVGWGSYGRRWAK